MPKAAWIILWYLSSTWPNFIEVILLHKRIVQRTFSVYASIFPFFTVKPKYILTSWWSSFLFTTSCIIKCPTLQIVVSESMCVCVSVFVSLHVYIYYVHTHTIVQLTTIPLKQLLIFCFLLFYMLKSCGCVMHAWHTSFFLSFFLSY